MLPELLREVRHAGICNVHGNGIFWQRTRDYGHMQNAGGKQSGDPITTSSICVTATGEEHIIIPYKPGCSSPMVHERRAHS